LITRIFGEQSVSSTKLKSEICCGKLKGNVTKNMAVNTWFQECETSAENGGRFYLVKMEIHMFYEYCGKVHGHVFRNSNAKSLGKGLVLRRSRRWRSKRRGRRRRRRGSKDARQLNVSLDSKLAYSAHHMHLVVRVLCSVTLNIN
jgi:hypothetical protein